MMQTIVPYLTVSNAKEAMGFYAKALGAEEKACVPHEDGRILHADLSVNGGSVFVMDAFPEHAANTECGSVHPPAIDKPSPTSIVINFAKPAEVDAAFKRAVDAGCRGVTGPEDTFWNARFAVVCDPYGHIWMLNAELPAKS
jgi:PhnB protein